MDEPISNILQVTEPPESTARVIYSYKNGSFIPFTNTLPFITLIELESTLIYHESNNTNLQTGKILCFIFLTLKKKHLSFVVYSNNNKYHFIYITESTEEFRNSGKEISIEEVKEESDHNTEGHVTGTDGNIEIQVQGEVDEGESEGEGDFPNEEGGEEIDEDKTSKPKATSDSDEEERAVVEKEEIIADPNSSAKQRSAPKKLMNQFNFSERCTLTEEIILRVYIYIYI